MGDPVEGKYRAYQDSGLWVRSGWLDWAVQMNYATRSFEQYLAAMKKAAGRKAFSSSVVVGLYCRNDLDTLLKQIELVRGAGSKGIALFSYGELFDERHWMTKKGRVLLSKVRPSGRN